MTREQEALKCRRTADTIRRQVKELGTTLCLHAQLTWMGVAEAYDRLAEALSLPAIGQEGAA